MSDTPDDIMEAARVLNMQLHSATKLGQKTQWIAEAIMEGRAKALEEAAKVAETGTFHGVFQTAGDRRCAEDIARRIRTLQSEATP